jgi:group I intron endonuclease
MLFIDKGKYSKQCGVYCIENRKNGRRYIGQTKKSFIARYYWHRSALRRGSHYATEMQQDYSEYGEENFVFFVLAVSNDPEELDRLEIEYIADEEAPYNTMRGGELIRIIPQSERKKRKNHKTSNPTQYVYMLPEETRRKMSATRTGQPYSIYSKCNVINDDQARAIKEKLVSGMTLVETAAATGVSYKTINNIVSNNTWKHIGVDGWDDYRSNRVVRTRLTEEQALKIQDKYNTGATIDDLAQEYGKCRSTIQNIIKHKTFS